MRPQDHPDTGDSPTGGATDAIQELTMAEMAELVDVTLYDVTHLACRSTRYTPAAMGGSCSPANAKQTAFPIASGGTMPPVDGCTKQDYAVLIVIGVGGED